MGISDKEMARRVAMKMQWARYREIARKHARAAAVISNRQSRKPFFCSHSAMKCDG